MMKLTILIIIVSLTSAIADAQYGAAPSMPSQNSNTTSSQTGMAPGNVEGINKTPVNQKKWQSSNTGAKPGTTPTPIPPSPSSNGGLSGSNAGGMGATGPTH